MNIKINVVAILTLSTASAISVQKGYLPLLADDDDGEPPPSLRDIPDKYYDDLIKEVPELHSILVQHNERGQAKSRQKRQVQSSQFFTNGTESGRRIYQPYPYDNPSGWGIWWSRNWVGKYNHFWYKTLYPIISCFWCGMNITYFVPTTTMCHDAFDSQDGRLRSLQRYFRGTCYYVNPVFVNMGHFLWYDWRYMGVFQGWNNLIYGSYYISPANWIDKRRKGKWGINFYYNYGLKRNFFGQYIGGCFKRYLDVGTLYTQRGCKHYFPIQTYGRNSISHRFRRLEYVLRWKKEGCVSSNHASLTPFNRGISLYARYHVCVCSKKYCNRAAHVRNQAALLVVAVWLSRIFI